VPNWSISRDDKVKLTKCQNHHHHGGVFDTWTEWAKPQAEWVQGSAAQPNTLAGWPGSKSVRPMTSWTCVYTIRGRPRLWRKGGGSCSTRPAGHVAWSVNRHLVSYRLSQVIGAPPQPYKYPCLVEIRTHTPLHGNSTWKALILSVVGMCSLVGRVVRL
jgi:hypothetical protein